MTFLVLGPRLGNALSFAAALFEKPELAFKVLKTPADFVLSRVDNDDKEENLLTAGASPQNCHLRGTFRRRLELRFAEVAPSLAPMINDLHSPMSSAVIPGDNLDEPIRLESFEEENGRETSETLQTPSYVIDSLPAFVIGFATSIIFCAGYIIISEMRERCKEQVTEGILPDITGWRNQRQGMIDGHSTVSATMFRGNQSVMLSAVGDDMVSSTHSVHYYKREPDGFLYPVILVRNGSRSHSMLRKQRQVNPDHDLYSDRSLSPVSTMTSSVAMESRSGRGIVALTESHRVCHDTKLGSLVNLGNMSASAPSSSSHSNSVVSLSPNDDVDEKGSIFKLLDDAQGGIPSSLEQRLQAVAVSNFDGVVAAPLSVMGGSNLNDDLSISEEDESGWTSSAGKSDSDSDSSSDVSIGTYLRSVGSARSRSSAPSIETGKSSVLLGEVLNLTPEKVFNTESREDENSMEFSLDDGSIIVISESRIEPSSDCVHDHKIMDQLQIVASSEWASLKETITNEEVKSVPKSIDIISSDLCVEDDEDGKNQDYEGHGNINCVTPYESSLDLGRFLEKENHETHELSVAAIKPVSCNEGSLLETSESRSSSCHHRPSQTNRGGNLVESKLGVDIKSASFPASNPKNVTMKSCAKHEAFPLDFILALRDTDATSWKAMDANSEKNSSGEVEKSEGSAEHVSIKLTLMGKNSGGSETGSSSSQHSIPDGCNSLCVGSVDKSEV
ncbi:hypothetical protein IV203_015447 [Nitzschia inconspicua]|uniref:Uncharacterized protein n=1 Tax=Nitzschia inconspicua TaxID=303405 RepID=A0A9K3K677_9STRA|nr:hypothetical protein IV203_020318 [Nitzschia inconspicua]KAG7358858.1 hypothetical protein IV203_015447 [Nitzschia inconspicua]